tara:strand:+ start:4362 stop:5009 length:648 start_codon:yes stop_codon:yes gene_type:complete
MENKNLFKENNYLVVKDFLHPDVQMLCYQYCVTRVQQKDFKFTYSQELYDNHWDGFWGDHQAPQSYSMYGDVLMDSILQLTTPKMSELTGMDLTPQYSYWRFYEKGEELLRHKDRQSCEISMTISLGRNYANIEDKYSWPIFIQDNNNKEIPVHLNDGDMLIYKGCELDHWREPLKGNHHAQLFLHYNDKNGSYKQQIDGRPTFGLPATYAKVEK